MRAASGPAGPGRSGRPRRAVAPAASDRGGGHRPPGLAASAVERAAGL